MDGLAQAVGSGPGPGTLSPPVNGFCPLLLATTSVQKMVLQCVFVELEYDVYVCVRECLCVLCVCVCGPKLSFTKELRRSLKFCSKLSLSVPRRKSEKRIESWNKNDNSLKCTQGLVTAERQRTVT